MFLTMEEKTKSGYFDIYTPDYELERYDFVLEFLKINSSEDSVLLDIGCGNGAFIELVQKLTPIKKIYGIDTSPEYLQIAKDRLDCSFHTGSVLDRRFIESLGISCDFIVMGAILHHLTGKTRKESLKNVRECIINACSLLKQDGHIIITEPTFYPRQTMTALFWTKRLFASFSPKRIHIFKSFLNIGNPVVSYLTNEQMREIISDIPGIRITDEQIIENRLERIFHLFFVSRRTDSTFILSRR